jgi:hypothetical protein
MKKKTTPRDHNRKPAEVLRRIRPFWYLCEPQISCPNNSHSSAEGTPFHPAIPALNLLLLHNDDISPFSLQQYLLKHKYRKYHHHHQEKKVWDKKLVKFQISRI